MRILTFIIFLLFNGTALLASPGGALHHGEITASWESGSDSDIMGNRILDDLRSNKEPVLKVNAFCSEESILKISQLRRMAASVIINSQNSGIISGDIHLAGTLLKNIGELSLNSLSVSEQRLVRESEKISLSGNGFSRRDITSGNIPMPEYAANQTITSLTVPASSNLKNHKDKNRDLILSDKYIICSRDLFEREFADLYRLFLYVKDNSGNRKKILTLNNPPLLCRLQPLCNSTRYINTTTTFNPIHPWGDLL